MKLENYSVPIFGANSLVTTVYGILVTVVATLIIIHIVKGLTSIMNFFGCKTCLISITESGSERATKKSQF